MRSRGARDWTAASEPALVRAARLGDPNAFAVIVERHGPAMYRYARRLLARPDDAGDVVQEAFVSAWRGLDGFRGDAALRSWLFRLVSRRAADVSRRRRPTPVDDASLVTITDPGPGPGQQHLDRCLLDALRAALSRLPWRQRAVWLLAEIEGLSYSEIALALSTTTGVVRGQLHRARRRLATDMEAWR